MDTPSLKLRIDALLTGKPAFIAPGVLSAMAKQPVSRSLQIHWLGLEGDSVADHYNHGGHDKALLLFPREHYDWWRGVLDDHPLLEKPGAFGENLSTYGATEANLCLGDRFSVGTALLEVSHGRQPCHKLNCRFGRNDVTAMAVESGHCGVYLRVVEQGEAAAMTEMILRERPHPEWPISRVHNLLIAGGFDADPAGVATLAKLPVLAEAWRERAVKLAR